MKKQLGTAQEVVKSWEHSWDQIEEASLLLQMAVEEHDAEAEQEVVANLVEIARELEQTELECMFSGEHDANNAILTIHAGAGGTEAQDWVDMLLRLYLRWAENNPSRPRFSTCCPATRPG